MENQHETGLSPLSATVKRDNGCVHIEIYENGVGGWILEAVDQYNNSIVWEDHFTSDQLAFDEAMKTIEREGIQSLIGSESGDCQSYRQAANSVLL